MEKKKKSKRGGRRPGAGAPKGNLNALKHGRRSAQFDQLGVLLAGNEKTREAMLNFARRLEGKQQTALAGAIELHARIIDEARKIARGEPSPLEHLLLDSRGRPNTNLPLSRAVGGWVERERGPGGEGLNVQSHDAERRSISQSRRGDRKTARATPSHQHARPPKRKNHRPDNQPASTTSPDNQTPNTKTSPKPID